MNDHDKFLNPEDYVSCPYDIAHTVPRKRLTTHLTKCRKQHVEKAKELRDCIHNNLHKIPRIEYEHHLETCPDRDNFYQSAYCVGEVENQAVAALSENIRIKLDVPEIEENWDEVPPTNVLDNIRREAKNKNVLENFSNKPPAERKALRNESRARARQALNEEERRQQERDKPTSASCSYGQHSRRDKSSPSKNWDNDDSSSVVSDNSIAESDVSYKTALSSTIHKLNDFHMEGKKKIGRGSGKLPLFTPNVQPGIGRGKKQGVYRSDNVWSSRRPRSEFRPYPCFRPYWY